MRTTIILPRDYENQFIYEARKCGLATKLDIPMPCPLLPEQEDILDQAMFSRFGARKQKIFQMVLLFDEIIIPAIDPTNDYTKLTNSGFFHISSLEEYMQYARTNNLYDDCVEDSLYLKHALLPILYKGLTSFYENDISTISKKAFAENLYDGFFTSKATGKVVFSPDMNKAIEKAIARKKIQRICHYTTSNIGFDSYLINDKLLFYEFWESIASEYEYLNMLLDIVNNHNANLINCEYPLAKIGCETFDISHMLNNYATVRIECKDIINMLPKPESLIDVIKLKEKKRKEIHKLQQVLSEFEHTVRYSGKAEAIEKIRHDAKLAVKELNQGLDYLSKVGTWTTVLSVPISVAENLLHIPSVIGIPIGITGTVALLSAKIKEKNNGWINIIR